LTSLMLYSKDWKKEPDPVFISSNLVDELPLLLVS